MKLAYVAHARLPVQKAHGIAIMRSCEALARAGAEVTLITAHRQEAAQADVFKAYGIELLFRVRFVWVPRAEWAPYRLKAILFYVQAVIVLLSTARDSVIYTRDAPLAPLALLGFSIAYECHFVPNRSQSFFALVRLFPRIVISSKTLLERFLMRGMPENRILVAPSGVDLSIFSIDVSQEEARAALGIAPGPVAVYTGRFTTMGMDKGISDVLEALIRVPHLRFIAVGGHDDDCARYAAQADVYGLSERTSFLGTATQQSLAQYQRAADMLLMPFPDTPYYRNNMSPIKMFEYMASGRPIIASDLPTIRAVLGDTTAVIVPPGNIEALADAMRRLADNPQQGTVLAAHARAEVAQYSWAERSRRVLEFLAPLETAP